MGKSIITLPPITRDDEKTLFQLYDRYLDTNAIEDKGNYDYLFVTSPLSSGFWRIEGEEMMHVISNLIANWNLREARGTGVKGTIVRARDIPYLRNNYRINNFFMNGRIDLQGRDSQKLNKKVRFERYAIQMGSQNFARVHIQFGKTFDVRYIRCAFWVSVLTSNDVWIGDGFPEIPLNIPAQWENYRNWQQLWVDKCAIERP
jgi:hypothetical protein